MKFLKFLSLLQISAQLFGGIVITPGIGPITPNRVLVSNSGGQISTLGCSDGNAVVFTAGVPACGAVASSSLTSAHIFVGNSSNVATDVAMTGDISITNAGVTSYNGTVPPSKGGAGIDNSFSTISTTSNIIALAPATGNVLMTGAGPNVRGITAPAATQMVTLYAVGGKMTLFHQDGTASAANRIILGSTSQMVISVGDSVSLWYDTTNSRWRVSTGAEGAPQYLDIAEAGSINNPSSGFGRIVKVLAGSPAAAGQFKMVNSSGASVPFSGDVQAGIIYRGNSNAIDLTNQLIYDTTPKISIDYYHRYLYDSGELLSENYDSRFLYYQDGATQSINWGTSQLIDGNGIPSADYSGRTLFDSSVQPSISWETRQLVDSASVPSVYYSQRILVDASENFSVDWANRFLYDSSNNDVVRWGTGLLVDNLAPSTSLDWINRLLYDPNGTLSIDYGNRTQRDDVGQYSIDWVTRVLQDTAAVQSLSWGGRFLYDTGNQVSIDWGSRITYYSNGSSPSLDWTNGYLYTAADGIGADYNARTLYGTSSVGSVEWGNRYLRNSAGNVVFTWDGQHPLIISTNTNDSAGGGELGQYLSASVVQGSAITLTTATPATITSISAGAGDWDISGVVCLNGTITGTQFIAAIGQTTNSLTGTVLGDTQVASSALSTATTDDCQEIPAVRKSLSGTTTIYLLAQSTFTVGTAKAYGRISARRPR